MQSLGAVQTAQNALSFVIQPEDADPSTIERLHACEAYNISVSAHSCAAIATSGNITIDGKYI